MSKPRCRYWADGEHAFTPVSEGGYTGVVFGGVSMRVRASAKMCACGAEVKQARASVRLDTDRPRRMERKK